jgi:hypothetical protein
MRIRCQSSSFRFWEIESSDSCINREVKSNDWIIKWENKDWFRIEER